MKAGDNVPQTAADSFNKRYFYKLTANFAGLLIGLVSQTIIPRSLGPRAYGDFNYLTNFFSQLISFLELNTSTGYFTMLSKNPKDSGLVRFYMLFGILVCVAVFFLVGASHITSLHKYIWPGEQIGYIYLAALFGLFTWTTQIFSQMTDAYGLTVAGEKAKMFQRVLGLPLLVLLFIAGRLTLSSFFLYNYALFIFLMAALIFIMKGGGFSLFKRTELTSERVRHYARQSYAYSHPLFVSGLVGMLVNIFDMWLLQVFGGSAEQGFFGLSSQIGALCFLFTGAMTPLLMREFSIVHAENDTERMKWLFEKYIPMMFSIAAFFSCFISVNAAKVIHIFGGQQYGAAFWAVSAMAFYPIHQTYGQLIGSAYYAMGKTALYRNIGIFVSVAGVPVSFFLIASPTYFGFGAGAMGLAVKMVAINVISVNALLFFIAKPIGISFVHYLRHQALCIGFMVVTAAVTALIVNQMAKDSIVIGFLVSGVIYTLATGVFAMYVPSVAGLKKEDIQKILQILKPKD
ncbi:MAG: lipopolysaccharide biosynthesis protein [Nitrospirae bacterium]|nr:lipopolysaccharide biosynthesis protein [Nitrospirota bacterium]